MSHRDQRLPEKGSTERDDGSPLTRRETIQRAGLLTLAAALGIPSAGFAAGSTRVASRFQIKMTVERGRETLATFDVDERTAALLARSPEAFQLDWYDREQSTSKPISSLRFDDRYQMKLPGYQG